MLFLSNFFVIMSAPAGCSVFFYEGVGLAEWLPAYYQFVLMPLYVQLLYLNQQSNYYNRGDSHYKMNVVKDLLSSVPQADLQAYQSYLQTHLKLLMTGISKAKVQDMTQVQIRKNNCIRNCYRHNLDKVQSRPAQQIYDTVQQIRMCKQRCGEEKKAVKKYLDDINYYSSLKMARCSKQCVGNQYSKSFNQCLWNCYNKLDRRYKVYWVEQRQKVENRFKSS